MHLIKVVRENDLKKVQKCTHRMSSLVLNGSDSNGNTALYYAAKNGNFLIVKHLCRIGCTLNIQCEYKNTELHAAFRSGNESLICFLIRKGSALYIRNKDAYTPLDVAHPRIAPKLGLSDQKGNVMTASETLQRINKALRSKSTVEETWNKEEPTYRVNLSVKKCRGINLREFAPLYTTISF